MAYTLHHPKWHRDSKPIFWRVRNWASIAFILRELTSVAVAYFAVLLILVYRALQSGPEAWAALVSMLANPTMIAFHVFALCTLLYHSITWFNLSPKAIVIRLGRWRIPDLLIAGGNYAAWIFISAMIALAYVAS